MKKFTFIVAMVLSSAALVAQTIVSTTAQNKKVVLEEFTGIHCTYCPDGHKIAGQIVAAHPGNVFAINIHEGSYATPGAGEPDFRTTFGTAISAQTSLAGYPAGTVNRHLFPGWSQSTSNPGTAMSRSKWAQASDTILSKPSYVNVAATCTINISTRVMTVYVEGYFTGTTAPASMKLNVAINQNNVEGPQTGGSSNPSQVLPNGNYNHQHMLRHLLTGQWGEDITTTTQTTLFTKTYTYTVPADINGVAMELGNLEVIVFLAETQQEIITGNQAVMTFITPPGVSVADLKTENMTTIPALCGTSVTPSVKVTNLSTVSVDSFNVQYVYNNGTPVTQLVTTPLAAGANTTITFPAVTLTASANGVEFNANFNNVYHLVDMTTGNNNSGTGLFYVMPAATIGATYTEDFESYAAGTEEIDHTIVKNPNEAPVFTITKALVSGLPQDLGGYAASTSSFFVNYYNIAAGSVSELIFHKLNFASNTQQGLRFDYAYAQYSNENDKLEILVSDNCGSTWTPVWSKAGAALKTAEPVSSGNFFPEAAQWASANIDLSAYASKPEVIVSFKMTSDYGNNLYFDNINFYNNTTIGIEDVVAENSANVMPNPAENLISINIQLAETSDVQYSVVNYMGQVVLNANLGNLNKGMHAEKVNIDALAAGVYFVKIQMNDQLITEKLIVK